jgi:hypothetical protein
MNHFRTWLYVAARYIVSFLIIGYGFAKLNGAQFNVLDSALDKPMGQVDAFWLVWYFFGYSHAYSTIIALTQVLGGVLLMFRRTTLLGACVLMPVIANILMVDIFFNVASAAWLNAFIIFGSLVFILAQHRKELLNLFWFKQNEVVPSVPRHVLLRVTKAILCGMIVVGLYAFTYLIANYNNRRPTPIDGTWEFVESSGANGARIPSTIFFEHNFAFLVVYKFDPKQYEEHHFRVDKDAKKVTIWERGGREADRSKKIFDGTYDVTDSKLILKGRVDEHQNESTLTWRKR